MTRDGKDFTTDDHTLLRAINILEGTYPSKILGQMINLNTKLAIIDTFMLQSIKDNDHLRSLLKTFLQSNIAVELKLKELDRESSKSWIRRIFNRSKVTDLQAELASLKVKRNADYRDYEMLRKLTDDKNLILKRLPA